MADAYIRITSKPKHWLVTKVRVANYGSPDNILVLVDRSIQDLKRRNVFYTQENGIEYGSALVNAMVENSNGHAVTYRGSDPGWSDYSVHIDLPRGVTKIWDKEANHLHSTEHLPEDYATAANVSVGPWLGSSGNPNTQPPPRMNTPLKSVESEIIDIQRRAGLLEDR